MRTAETVARLAAFDRRGAGTDAERRAARWLESELGGESRNVVTEPFWCRPNWAFAHAWHAALGLAGSLVSVESATLGWALILVALLSVIADALIGRSLGRRLTPEHASQNVVAPSPHKLEAGRRVRLVLTANYDAGRGGIAFWNRPRRAAARLRALTHGLTPGWQGWLVIALLWVEVVAIARATGAKGTTIGIVQFPPTVVLLLCLALLLDIASADFGPSAGDNASGVAVALALGRALDAAPPRHAVVEIVLTGAGDGSGIGLSRYLRNRKRQLARGSAIVLGIGPCGAGSPRWWIGDGSLVPLAYFPKLKELCATLAREDPGLGARPHRGRGTSPAYPGRLARLPAITIGCLDAGGLAPRSHQRSDTPDQVEERALDSGVEFGLMLIDAIDAFLASAPGPAPSSPDARSDQPSPTSAPRQ